MSDKELLSEEELEFIIRDFSTDGRDGCINCEFNEYRDGIKNYCSEHERYVKDYDPPCKAYVEEGSY